MHVQVKVSEEGKRRYKILVMCELWSVTDVFSDKNRNCSSWVNMSRKKKQCLNSITKTKPHNIISFVSSHMFLWSSNSVVPFVFMNDLDLSRLWPCLCFGWGLFVLSKNRSTG